MDDKLAELASVVLAAKKFPYWLRLFLITERKYIRIYYGGAITVSAHNKEFGLVRDLSFERGKILDLFAKLEFFINEITYIKLLGFDPHKGYFLDKLLERIDLFSRIQVLRDLEIIDASLHNLLMQTKQVRNGFAHMWDETGLIYKGKPIKQNFVEFKQDMESIWRGLLNIYKIEQDKINVKDVITKIKNMNDE